VRTSQIEEEHLDEYCKDKILSVVRVASKHTFHPSVYAAKEPRKVLGSKAGGFRDWLCCS
jgi:hypothetical protein